MSGPRWTFRERMMMEHAARRARESPVELVTAGLGVLRRQRAIPDGPKPLRFLDVEVVGDGGRNLVLCLDRGVRVEVPAGFDADEVRRLVDALC
jgi:hypothetical protein